MKLLKTLILTFFTLSCFAQKEHTMSDNYAIYVHEYEQELVSKLLSEDVKRVVTYEKHEAYYKSDKEFVKSIRYFNSNGQDSLTLFKAINGTVLNKFTFEYAKNKISKIVINDSEDSVSYRYEDRKILSDDIHIVLDAKIRIVKEVSEDITTNFIYNDVEKTKKTVFPEDYKDYNQISYFSFDKGLITAIKTINVESNKVESDLQITYKFHENKIKEMILHDEVSNKKIRNVLDYR